MRHLATVLKEREAEPVKKTLANMTDKEKEAHLAKIMGRINKGKYEIEDVTPKGYRPDK